MSESETTEKKTKRKSRESRTSDIPLRKSPRLASREDSTATEEDSEPKTPKRKTAAKKKETSEKKAPVEESSSQNEDEEDEEKKLASREDPPAAEKGSEPKTSKQKTAAKKKETSEKKATVESSSQNEDEENEEKKDESETTEVNKQKSTESTETSEVGTSEMSEGDWENAKSVHDFKVRNIKGEEVPFEKYKGYVLLIVNVASKCGLTSSNYAQLAKLDEQLRDKGLRILAFPCNQFGKQEPGSPDEICEFVKKKNANFDIFEKIEVNGKTAHPLYKYLKKQQPGTFGDFIKWNFTKFIVDKEGKPVERHPPTASPESLVPNIEKYL